MAKQFIITASKPRFWTDLTIYTKVTIHKELENGRFILGYREINRDMAKKLISKNNLVVTLQNQYGKIYDTEDCSFQTLYAGKTIIND